MNGINKGLYFSAWDRESSHSRRFDGTDAGEYLWKEDLEKGVLTL